MLPRVTWGGKFAGLSIGLTSVGRLLQVGEGLRELHWQTRRKWTRATKLRMSFRDFLGQLEHAQIPFGEVIVKRHCEVGQEGDPAGYESCSACVGCW